MSAMAPQIASLTIVYSIVYIGADQRKYQNSASLAFVRGIHRGPVNSPHKGQVTRKMLPFDDVIMFSCVRFQFDLGTVGLEDIVQSGINAITSDPWESLEDLKNFYGGEFPMPEVRRFLSWRRSHK